MRKTAQTHHALARIRQVGLGQLVFGNVFSWQNLVAYTIGITVGVIVEWLLTVKLRASGGHT